jgi:hypothetical protein
MPAQIAEPSKRGGFFIRKTGKQEMRDAFRDPDFHDPQPPLQPFHPVFLFS